MSKNKKMLQTQINSDAFKVYNNGHDINVDTNMTPQIHTVILQKLGT